MVESASWSAEVRVCRLERGSADRGLKITGLVFQGGRRFVTKPGDEGKGRFIYLFIHIFIPVATTNGTLRTVHPQHATGAKAGWVLCTHSETICPMGGIGLQTGLERGRGVN